MIPDFVLAYLPFVVALVLGGMVGWRGVFYITGTLGIVLAVAIFLGVREPKRGSSEPELRGLEEMRDYRFDWQVARRLPRNRTLLLLIG
ncbi:MAG: hypothetical protein K6T35_13035, partial [Meiothermus silvanus]|nr:hypothetical protein [Allomeiothermus silvanus]